MKASISFPRILFPLILILAFGGTSLVSSSAYAAGQDGMSLANEAPRAAAGIDRTVITGELVTLDATASTDREGDRLQYHWTLTTPQGSGARLSNPAAARPTFTVDVLGDYVATVVAYDDLQRSQPATVRVSTGNVAPVAVPGSDIKVAVGQGVALDASASFDVNRDALSYRWEIVEAPAASRALVGATHASNTYFTPDQEGDYLLSLTVSDGFLSSAPAYLHLSTHGVAPLADAGSDRLVAAGAALRLGHEAVAIRDAAYSWSLIHAPASSVAMLDDAYSPTPLLRTGTPGLYVVQLIVSDGVNTSAPDTMVIEALARGGLIQSFAEGAADTDGDGIPDTLDNCAEQYNPSQLDTNGDGFGNRCDPDLDNDGFITNVGDLAILKQAFFSVPGDMHWNPDADFNGDNQINVLDLSIMKFFFFGPPGPIAITFINPAGGDWHDPMNWSPAVVPDIRYTVRIDLDPGVVVEYSTGNSAVAGLRATSPLLFSGGKLSIKGDALFDGDVTLASGAALADANILPPTVDPRPIIDIPNGAQVNFDNVTLGSDVNIGRSSAQLTIENGLTLNGSTISINSISNGYSTMLFSGANGATSAFDGTGEVRFTGSSNLENRGRITVSGNGHGLAIGSGITIRSVSIGGSITNTAGPITMDGVLVSDVASNVVSISAEPLIIGGSVSVSNNATLIADSDGTGGEITSSATLNVNTGEMSLRGNFTQDGTITATDSTLDIGDAIADDWTNTGTIVLDNATLELGGTFMLSDVGNITGTSTTVLNGTFINSGMTVDLQAALPGMVELRTGATIFEGAVNGAELPIPNGEDVTFDDVMLGADVSIGTSSAELTILNGLTMNGSTISISSISNGYSTLRFEGADAETSILGGTGEILFTGTSSIEARGRIQAGASTHGLIIGSGITIESDTIGGSITNSSGPITFLGTIVSDVTNNDVSISAMPLTLSGSVDVSNDASFTATFNGVGGEITSSATLAVNSGGEIELRGDFTQDGSITVTDSTLDFGNAISDSWVNTGTITMNNARLELGGTFRLTDVGTVTGTGTTVINGTFDNTGQTVDLLASLPGTVEFATGATVLHGVVNGGALTIPNGQHVTFDGIILGADVSVGTSSARITVENNLTLSGGATITLQSASNGYSTLAFEGAGGEVSTLDGNGEIVFNGDSSIEDRNRLAVDSSTHGLTIGAGITIRSGTIGGSIFHSSNNGPITMLGTIVSDVTSNVVRIAASPLTLSGSVSVSNDAIFRANFQDTGGEITSSATLSANAGEIELQGDFTQDGAITVTNSTLDLGNAVGDDWSNTGTITMSGATMELGGTFTLADVGSMSGSGTTVINGLFDNTGQTVDLVSSMPGTVEFAAGAEVLGGMLTGGALTIPGGQTVTFDGVTLAADVAIGTSSAQLTIENDLTLSGGAALTLQSTGNGYSTLRITGAAGETSTIGGTGEIVFNGSSSIEARNRLIVGSSTHGLIIGSGVTVRTGTIGGAMTHNNSNGPITVLGALVSDVSGNTLSISASPLTLSGSVNVSNDARVQVTFQGVDGEITSTATLGVTSGEIELRGDFTQDGTITVTNSLLDIGNAVGDEWSNTGTITVNNAELELGGTFTLTDVGTITGTGTTTINGTFDNTGQTVDLQTALPGTVKLGTDATILNGTLTGGALEIPNGQTATFDGITLAADVSVGTSSAQLAIENDLILSGGAAVTLQSEGNGYSTLRFNGDGGATSTLGGTGEVVFNGNSSIESRNRLLVGGSTHGLIIGSGISVRSGAIGGSITNSGPITIEGTVISDVMNNTVSMSGSPLTINGDLDVGAGAVMSAGAYTLGSGSQVNVDIGGTATTEFGRFNGISGAMLDGTLNLTLVNGFSPMLADTFQVLTFNSRTGTFGSETGTSIGGGLSFDVNYNASDVTLEVIN